MIVAQFHQPVKANFVSSFILRVINFSGRTLAVDSNVILPLRCSCTLWRMANFRASSERKVLWGKAVASLDGGPSSRKLIWNSALQHCHLLARLYTRPV